MGCPPVGWRSRVRRAARWPVPFTGALGPLAAGGPLPEVGAFGERLASQRGSLHPRQAERHAGWRASWRAGQSRRGEAANAKARPERTLGAGLYHQRSAVPPCWSAPSRRGLHTGALPERGRPMGAPLSVGTEASRHVRRGPPEGCVRAVGWRSMPCPALTVGGRRSLLASIRGDPLAADVRSASRPGRLRDGCRARGRLPRGARRRARTVSPARCARRRVYWSLATTLFVMCQV